MKFLTSLLLAGMTAGSAEAFDRKITSALSHCHNYLWDVPEFVELPNAAISVWPASENGNLIKIYWVADWADPTIKAAGQCEILDEKITGFENYLRQANDK